MNKKLLLLYMAWLISVICHAQSYVPELNNKKIKVQPVVPVKAYAFNLRDVRLLDGSPFKNAMDRDAAYMLRIEPKRLLHRFYENAGLPTQGRCIWRLGK